MDETANHARKILFVCSRNRRRSLTAERLLAGVPGYEARSAGTQPSARIVLNAGHIGWADVIVFMEKSHLNRAREKHAEVLAEKELVVLHIPDDYEFMQPELVALLHSALAGQLGSAQARLGGRTPR